jgi:hypothetical protein
MMQTLYFLGIRRYYGCSYIEDKKGVPDEGSGDVDYGRLQRLGRCYLDHLTQTLYSRQGTHVLYHLTTFSHHLNKIIAE